VLRLWAAKVRALQPARVSPTSSATRSTSSIRELEVGAFRVRGEFYPRTRRPVGRRCGLGARSDRGSPRAPHGHQPLAAAVHDIEIGFDAGYRIVALVDRFTADLGAYIRTHGVVVPELTAALMPGPYRIPNYFSEALCVLTNKTPTGTYRGPGRYECTFVRERLLDIAAGQLGIDPLDLRRRNFIASSEMPYEVGGASLSQRTVYDCGDYRSAFEQALDAVGYPALRAEQASARGTGRYLGIGVGCVVEKAGLGPWEYARVEVDATGHVVVYSGVASVGQGIETTLAQVVADELAVSPEGSPSSTATARRCRSAGASPPRRLGGLTGGAGAARRVRAKAAVAAASERCRRSRREDGAVHVRGLPDRLTFRELRARPCWDLRAWSRYAAHFFAALKMTIPRHPHRGRRGR
jgi:CO/xanthine dehydrogenase Mo-binding subunit